MSPYYLLTYLSGYVQMPLLVSDGLFVVFKCAVTLPHLPAGYAEPLTVTQVLRESQLLLVVVKRLVVVS